MERAIEKGGLLCEVVVSIRVLLVTMAICCTLYPLAILAVGQASTPHTANGSLVHNDQGQIVGSELIAQGFSRPEYFWPRPSAVEYNAAAAGGSNLSPTNPELRARVKAQLARFGAGASHLTPADLVTASGSGLDPYITLAAARYQARRVASTRGIPPATVMELVAWDSKRPGGVLTPEPLVNVLLVNMELDRLGKRNE
jgi:K+-transporting ATPase ATPase C chain